KLLFFNGYLYKSSVGGCYWLGSHRVLFTVVRGRKSIIGA
ncbi:MAG: hypothetical protein ACJAUL_003473, partial [Paraglaciecola sp.]